MRMVKSNFCVFTFIYLQLLQCFGMFSFENPRTPILNHRLDLNARTTTRLWPWSRPSPIFRRPNVIPSSQYAASRQNIPVWHPGAFNMESRTINTNRRRNVKELSGVLVLAPDTFHLEAEETLLLKAINLRKDSEVIVRVTSPQFASPLMTKTIGIKIGETVKTVLTIDFGTMPLSLPIIEANRNSIAPSKTLMISAELEAEVKGLAFRSVSNVKITLCYGNVFIQLDKPIYTPGQQVKARIILTDNFLKPYGNGSPMLIEILNPHRITVQRDEMNYQKSNGILPFSYSIPTDPNLGMWTMNIKHGYKFLCQKNITFEVREYVLPTFEVKIEVPKYILPHTKTIECRIISKYVYGEPVNAIVSLTYYVKDKSGNEVKIGTLPGTIAARGETISTVNMLDLQSMTSIPWFPNIHNYKFVIEAMVTEVATGTQETRRNEETMFVKSLYHISFGRSLPDFKPGFSYSIQVDVKYPNGEPAVGVNVVLEKLELKTPNAQHSASVPPLLQETDENGAASFTISVPLNTKKLMAQIVTKDTKLPDESNGRGSLIVIEHQSAIAGYLWIRPADKVLRVGSIFHTEVFFTPASNNDQVHYFIITRGVITFWGEPEIKGKTYTRIIRFEVTAQMAPSSRLVVYSLVDGHLIMDSLRLEVEHRCEYNQRKELQISLWENRAQYVPKEEGWLNVIGEENSHVGVMAVDKSIFLLRNTSTLTKPKIFQAMDECDLGRGPGGGVTVTDVLKNAGVVVLLPNNHNSRYNSNNNGRSRRKRDAGTIRSICCEEAQSGFNEEIGICFISEDIYCTYGADAICLNAYEECCPVENVITAMTSCLEESEGTLSKLDFMTPFVPRSGIPHSWGRSSAIDDEEGLDEVEADELDVRKQFPETWLYEDFEVGDSKCKLDNSEFASCHLPFIVPDSITTWSFQSLAISQKTGFCVSDELSMTVKKALFIQVKLPYVAVRSETLELIATVFNYGNERAIVRVAIYGIDGICCEAAKNGVRGKQHRLIVLPKGEASHKFQLVPTKTGKFDIRVEALSLLGSDVVIRQLTVIFEGIRQNKFSTALLDPSNSLQRSSKIVQHSLGIQMDTATQPNKSFVEWDVIPPKNAIPGTIQSHLYLIGDIVGPAVDTNIIGLDGLFEMPTGCGEQTLATMAGVLYVTRYLEDTKRLTNETREQTRELLRTGYANALKFRKINGGYSVWKESPATIWLTAFAMKVLCDASPYITLNKDTIQKDYDRILAKQSTDGAIFDKIDSVPHPTLGELSGPLPQTALVVRSLVACKLYKDVVVNYETALEKAVTFMESNLANITKQPYILALVTTALLEANSKKGIEAFTLLEKLSIDDKGYRYWVSSKEELDLIKANKPWTYATHSTAIAVEITAFALLSQVYTNQSHNAGSTVFWLNSQRNSKGSFVSTHDTIVTLQALAAYGKKMTKLNGTKSQIRVYGGNVLISNVSIDERSSNVLNKIEVPTGNTVRVEAEGNGIVSATLDISYNTIESNKTESPLKISTTISDGAEVPSRSRRQTGFKRISTHVSTLNIKIGYDTQLKEKSGMVVVDVGIPTGFIPDRSQLLKIRDSKDSQRLITHFEILELSLILYLNEVPIEPNFIIIPVRFRQENIVADLKPVRIKVYRYYEPEISTVTFYSLITGEEEDPAECNDDLCSCIQGDCPPCNAFESAVHQRTAEDIYQMICNTHIYGWIITVKSKAIEQSIPLMKMTAVINEVLLNETEDKNTSEGDNKTFYGRSTCKCPTMEPENTYLVFGSSSHQYKNPDNSNSFLYILDENVWVTLWPDKTSFRSTYFGKTLMNSIEKVRKEQCSPIVNQP